MTFATSTTRASLEWAAGILTFATLLGATPVTARAQATGSIMGLVLNESDLSPSPDALVALPETPHRTRTDAHGWFQLLDVPAGQVLVRIEGEGYVTFVETIGVAPLEESLIHFHLNRVSAILDRLLVGVPGTDDPARGHSEARVVGIGAMDRTAADLLMRNVPGVNASAPQGGAGTGVRIRLRGVSSFVLSEEPQIYLDGVRIDAGGQDRAMLTLAEIPASSVARIRVLRGPASTSMYPAAAAGVILVETVRPDG